MMDQFKIVDVGQFKDINSPVNDNRTIAMAHSFYCDFKDHRLATVRDYADAVYVGAMWFN